MPNLDRPDTTPEPWWRDAVIYQIYVRSFADADGDGVGDLAGIRARLASLVDLGVDAIWLTPFYPSPQADGGYDVSDHRGVDPLFGTLDDFDDLVASTHDAGLRLLVDIVPNHTSSEHRWFRAALAAPPGSPERARYVFRNGRGLKGERAPNDWRSVFGGPAWTRVPEVGRATNEMASPDGDQWYLHLFAPEQPDLDWTNDEVRAEFETTLRFWLDRGVDGFRIDVANGLVKEEGLPDLDGRFSAAGLAEVGHPHWDRDGVHDIYRAWRIVSDSYPGERIFVAEAYLESPERLARYVRPDELHTAFNFRFLLAPWNAEALRESIDHSIATLADVGAPPTWVLSNHDVVRHVTRYGGGDLGTRRARAAILMMLSLPGVAYLYQGEELGLHEVTDLPDEVLQDPTFLRSGGVDRGRDGCRVPLPWSAEGPSFGFGPTAQSWLPQPAEWGRLGRSAQLDDPASMLTLYREALALRRRLDVPSTVPLTWLATDADVLSFRRGDRLVCTVNLRREPIDPPGVDGTTLAAELASTPLDASGRIPGDSAAIFTVSDL